MSRICILAGLLLTLIPAGNVSADDAPRKERREKRQQRIKKQRGEVAMAGHWARPKGEGGWIFLYVRGEGGPVIYLPKGEVPGVRWANWVSGMEGAQFAYKAPDGKFVTLTQSTNDPETMSAAWADGSRETLVRTKKVTLASPLYGAWKGDWGGTVHLVEVGDAIYHIHVGTKGKLSVAVGKWAGGMEGTQYVYKYHDTKQRTGTLNAKEGQPRIMLTGEGGKRWAMDRIYRPLALLARLADREDERVEEKVRYLHGIWRHSAYGELHLSANKKDFHVSRLQQADAAFELQAGWTKGMRGLQFELVFRGETITCVYNREKPAVLRCTDSAGEKTEWRKL